MKLSYRSFDEYYEDVLASGLYDEEYLNRLFPQLHCLNQISPILQESWNLESPIPTEVCTRIAEFSADKTSSKFYFNYQAGFAKHCHQCTVTESTCRSGGCDWSCVCSVCSLQPLLQNQYFKFRYNNPGYHVGIGGYQVGIGITKNPNGRTGIRFNQESCGFYLDAKVFFYGRDENNNNEECCETNILDGLRLRYKNTDNIMELAVDYTINKILVKWPYKDGILLFDLPKHFHGHLLFPLVQTWNGCELSLV